MLKDTVELFLEKYDLLKPKNNILVAFSGGYDSMCLLDIMKKLAKEYELNLCAVHLNHGWRGEESDYEENICRTFCKDINFYSEKLPDSIRQTETAAREARYDFFQKCAEKFNSKAVLTAHNANDNAETIFYRMIKGTGFTGLEGIQEKRGIYYRPLLTIYRNEIEAYCKKNNLTPNNDSSNFNTEYHRNKIRHEIFPELKKITPDFEKNLNKIGCAAQSANKIIEKSLKNLEDYSPEDFSSLEEYLQNTVVHKFVRKLNLDYDRKKIEEITTFINKNKNLKSGKKHSLCADKWLFVNNQRIKILTNSEKKSLPEVHITKDGTYEIGGYRLIITKCSQMPDNFPPDKNFTAYTQLDDIDFTLRQRKNGDLIQPLGTKGKQKLKKYLIAKQIPEYKRDDLLFLCRNNEVFWAPGLAISDKIKVITQPTHMLKLEKR